MRGLYSPWRASCTSHHYLFWISFRDSFPLKPFRYMNVSFFFYTKLSTPIIRCIIVIFKDHILMISINTILFLDCLLNILTSNHYWCRLRRWSSVPCKYTCFSRISATKSGVRGLYSSWRASCTSHHYLFWISFRDSFPLKPFRYMNVSFFFYTKLSTPIIRCIIVIFKDHILMISINTILFLDCLLNILTSNHYWCRLRR